MKKEGNLLMFQNYKNEFEIRVVKSFLICFIITLILLTNINPISAEKYTLKVTEEHPFFLNGEWIPAKNLQVGDLLFTDDGKKAKITSIKEVIDDVEVYNLEAKPFNDFIVLGNVVVHNSNPEQIAELNKIIDAINQLLTQKPPYTSTWTSDWGNCIPCAFQLKMVLDNIPALKGRFRIAKIDGKALPIRVGDRVYIRFNYHVYLTDSPLTNCCPNPNEIIIDPTWKQFLVNPNELRLPDGSKLPDVLIIRRKDLPGFLSQFRGRLKPIFQDFEPSMHPNDPVDPTKITPEEFVNFHWGLDCERPRTDGSSCNPFRSPY